MTSDGALFPEPEPPTELARLIAESDGPPQPVHDFARANPRASSLLVRLYPGRYAYAGLAAVGLVAVLIAQPWKGSPPFRSTDKDVEFSALTQQEKETLPNLISIAPESATDPRQTLAHFAFSGRPEPSGGLALTLTWSAAEAFSASDRSAFRGRLDSNAVFSHATEGLPIDGHLVYEQSHGHEELQVVVERGVLCFVLGRSHEASRAAMVQLVHDRIS